MEIPKKVYLTALTNERYIPGAMALVRSLKEVNSKYSIAIMIPDDKKDDLEHKIRAYGILDYANTFILVKEKVSIPDTENIPLIVEEKYSYWQESFFKIRATGCTEFDKIVLLDCDQMAVKNIDHLFDLPAFSSTTCGRCVHPDWGGLSSGLLVIEPSEQLFAKMTSCIMPAIKLKFEKGQQAGDQDVFHLAFPEWRNQKDLYLPEKYNICWFWISDLCSVENCTPKDLYMIHFPGKEKPWDFSENYYIRVLLSLLRKRKTKQIIYTVRMWHRYRLLCKQK